MYENITAKITEPNGHSFYYSVLEVDVQTPEDEILEDEEDVKDLFYNIIDRETLNSWSGCTVELTYTWGKEVRIETVIEM
ncbi:hypothetical protein [Eubacterium oxidoreducens]|uniref:Uncharacterized protein n=1 Tax=Eubacterium oxidoreducens TaxID=1732 RepID=A0A1G6B2M7_EUBOX|nr:hypothetical protein [Eubacterium oxidoreducens]SDB14908.1 hypothetical protein SAMN02910417_01091 [Eubacterium oxidoreducens]